MYKVTNWFTISGWCLEFYFISLVLTRAAYKSTSLSSQAWNPKQSVPLVRGFHAPFLTSPLLSSPLLSSPGKMHAMADWKEGGQRSGVKGQVWSMYFMQGPRRGATSLDLNRTGGRWIVTESPHEQKNNWCSSKKRASISSSSSSPQSSALSQGTYTNTTFLFHHHIYIFFLKERKI